MTMDEINRCINMANEWSAKAMELVDSINKMDLTGMASEDSIESEVDEVDETSSDCEEDEKNKLLQEDSNLADDLALLEKKIDEVDEKIGRNNKEHKLLWEEYNNLSAKVDDIHAKREAIHKEWCEKFCKPTASDEASSPKNEAVKKTSKPKIPSTAKILGHLECYFSTKLDLVDPYSSLNKLLNGKVKTVKFINHERPYDLYDISGILNNVGEMKLSIEVDALADYYADEK